MPSHRLGVLDAKETETQPIIMCFQTAAVLWPQVREDAEYV